MAQKKTVIREDLGIKGDLEVGDAPVSSQNGRLTNNDKPLAYFDDTSSVKLEVTSAGHGFSSGEAIRYTGSVWTRAQANNAENAEAQGLVRVVDVNTFYVIMRGEIDGLTGLENGTVYYVDKNLAGQITNEEPLDSGDINKPILFATSATTGIVIEQRGIEITEGLITADTIGYSPANSLLWPAPAPSNMNSALNYLATYMVPVGMPVPWISIIPPLEGNWIDLRGQEVSRTSYSRLFAVYGTQFGAGDESNTFNLPDLRGRALFGTDNMGGDVANVSPEMTVLGATGGEHEHTLTEAEMPSHTHDYQRATGVEGDIFGGGSKTARDNEETTTASTSTGGDGAHNNLPPYITTKWITRYE